MFAGTYDRAPTYYISFCAVTFVPKTIYNTKYAVINVSKCTKIY